MNGRGPGRPRTEGHEAQILDAVTTLIDGGRDVTVSAVVAESGISRASLYRRWPSMSDLVAAALDRGRAPLQIDVDDDGNVKQAIVDVLFGDQPSARGREYTERRFRKRLALVMENRELQHAYWSSHVSRRRAAMANALVVAMERGELRQDIDVDACIDAINGLFYYQAVVRGTGLDDPSALRRCRTAFETIWRGMSP